LLALVVPSPATPTERSTQPLTIDVDVVLDGLGRGEVQVRVSHCGLCHSDLCAIDCAFPVPVPVVLGHEAAGVVEAVGAEVTRVAVGDHVVLSPYPPCGQCYGCTHGEPGTCVNTMGILGFALPDGSTHLRRGDQVVYRGLGVAAFADQVITQETGAIKIPDDVPLDVACLIGCAVQTGVGAVLNTARMRPGATVAVIGAGGVGLNAIQGAALGGAVRIIAVDLNPAKLETAREFGATEGVLAGPEAAAEVRALTAGRGVDHVFVAVGIPAVLAEAPAMLAAGGSLVVVGMPATGSTVGYDPTTLAAMNQSILGSRMGQSLPARDIPQLIGHWRAGRLKLAELISGRYSLEAINEAIAATRSGAARRNVIVFGEAL
jgi:Zn-dependent alcohol dehydrogenase